VARLGLPGWVGVLRVFGGWEGWEGRVVGWGSGQVMGDVATRCEINPSTESPML